MLSESKQNHQRVCVQWRNVDKVYVYFFMLLAYDQYSLNCKFSVQW